jgi:hypothetical protein
MACCFSLSPGVHARVGVAASVSHIMLSLPVSIALNIPVMLRSDMFHIASLSHGILILFWFMDSLDRDAGACGSWRVSGWDGAGGCRHRSGGVCSVAAIVMCGHDGGVVIFGGQKSEGGSRLKTIVILILVLC